MGSCFLVLKFNVNIYFALTSSHHSMSYLCDLIPVLECLRQKLNLLLYHRFAPPCETPRNKLQAWTRLCTPDKIPAPIIWLHPRPRIEKEKPCYSKNRGRKRRERHIIWAPTIRSCQQKEYEGKNGRRSRDSTHVTLLFVFGIGMDVPGSMFSSTGLPVP